MTGGRPGSVPATKEGWEHDEKLQFCGGVLGPETGIDTL